jgi:ribokinase
MMHTAGQGVPPTVVCMGSLNMDMCVDVGQAPVAGETVMAQALRYSPGGKGANQAVACARQGARVRMIGSVGADAHGATLLDSLQADGIDTLAVETHPHQPTGVAMVLVESSGQNRIVVAGGANQAFRWDAASLQPVLRGAYALVLQLESPVPEVLKAAQWARASGCMVVLNPSPVPENIPGALWALVDLLVLNESEALALCGLDVGASRDAAVQAVRHFQQWGIARVVLTLGGAGAIAADGDALTYHPAAKVDVVDTTAAGDTFLGALVAAWAAGLPFAHCVRQGMAAASWCVQTAGAQTSIPTRAQTEASVPVPDWQRL